MSISEQIRIKLTSLRKTHGLSIGDMARSLGIDPSAWHHIESGKRSPSVGLLDKIQKVYGITIDLGGCDENKSL